MKTYDETIERVFERIGKYEKEKKRRRKLLAAAAASVCCLCLAALSVMMLQQNGKLVSDISSITDEASAHDSQSMAVSDTSEDNTSDDTDTSENEQSAEVSDRPVFWGNEISGSGDAGYVTWNDKSVSCALYDVLCKDEYADHAIAISTGFIVDESFEYNGKTIKEYVHDAENEHERIGRLLGLLKVGDELKYGEELYKSGAPGGDKWAKEFYEETVAYYGEALLKEYIVNGEFLREKVETDIEKYEGDMVCRRAYEAALIAYYRHSAKEAIGKLNVPCEFNADMNSLTIFATAEEFAAISIDNAQYYGLAIKNTDPDHGEDMATENAAP